MAASRVDIGLRYLLLSWYGHCSVVCSGCVLLMLQCVAICARSFALFTTYHALHHYKYLLYRQCLEQVLVAATAVITCCSRYVLYFLNFLALACAF